MPLEAMRRTVKFALYRCCARGSLCRAPSAHAILVADIDAHVIVTLSPTVTAGRSAFISLSKAFSSQTLIVLQGL